MTGGRTGFRLALGTLTIIPCGDLGEVDRDAARWAMLLAPLAVLPVAGGAALVTWAGREARLPALATGLLTVGLIALLTRAIHLDGLADTVDGLGGGWTRERALAIMHTPDVGPMGAVALLLTIGLQAACIGSTDVHPLLVAAAVVASRCCLAPTCTFPSARESGMGALMAGTVSRWAATVVVLLGAALVVTVATTLVDAGSFWQALLATGLTVIVVGILLRRCLRRLGGVTGDVMGACVEVAFTVTLLVLAVR